MQCGWMRGRLLDAFDAAAGVLTRREVLAVVPHHVLDRAVAAGVVLRFAPRVYVLAEVVDHSGLRRRAALRYAGSGALSHLDALDVWGLPYEAGGESPQRPVHVTI